MLDTGNQRIGPAPFDYGKTVGGFFNPCDPLGTCNTGAQLGAEVSGNLGLEYGVNLNAGSMNLAYPVNVSLTTPGVYSGQAGNPFTISSSYTVPGYTAGALNVLNLGTVTANTQVTGPTLQAYVNLDAKFHAFIGAQACLLGACQGPYLGPLDVDKSQTLVSINQNNDHLIKVGDTTVKLDQNVSALDGDVTARLNIPNLNAASSKTAGSNANTLVSVGRDNLAAVDANVGNIISKALGLPLTGNIGGIGYNLLSVNAGLALDVKQTLSVSLTPEEQIAFLRPVQEKLANGSWSAPTSTVTFALGSSVTLRSQAQGMVGLAYTLLDAKVTNSTDLVLDGDFSAQALGANAFGQQIGPLLDTGNLDAGLIDIPVYKKTFDDNLGNLFTGAFPILQTPSCVSVICSLGNLGDHLYTTNYCGNDRTCDYEKDFAVDLDATKCSPEEIEDCPAPTISRSVDPACEASTPTATPSITMIPASSPSPP